ncbi:hypothetical protein J6590_063032 [Homalodisca vitripennis]|nr:hypothetical protein J6590_063032 [Homalodisca vitripennis]
MTEWKRFTWAVNPYMDSLDIFASIIRVAMAVRSPQFRQLNRVTRSKVQAYRPPHRVVTRLPQQSPSAAGSSKAGVHGSETRALLPYFCLKVPSLLLKSTLPTGGYIAISTGYDSEQN